MISEKIKSLSDLKNILKKDPQKKVVFTNGCFDILHCGHVTYLEQAKALGDILVVGLNADSSVKKLKGESRPINSESDRAIVLAALESTNYICIFSEDTPMSIIQSLRPDIHVKGGDYKAEDLPEYPILKAYGAEVCILSFVPGKSSSSIMEKIKN
jgi:D-glycero-beta-D-manno-heptose 1-phosphate adenylyltransferase